MGGSKSPASCNLFINTNLILSRLWLIAWALGFRASNTILWISFVFFNASLEVQSSYFCEELFTKNLQLNNLEDTLSVHKKAQRKHYQFVYIIHILPKNKTIYCSGNLHMKK